MAGAYAIVSGGGDNRVSPDRALDISRVAALGAWRMSQGVYRFDETILEELWNTPVTGELPIDLLHRFPEWCLYLELERDDLHGCFAHLEYDTNDRRQELRLLLDYDIGLIPVPIHLVGDLEHAVQSAADEAKAQAALHASMSATAIGIQLDGMVKDTTKLVEPLVSLLLYICSQAAEIVDAAGTNRRPRKPQPKKTKHGVRLFAPQAETVWEIGYRIGSALRRARAQQEDRPRVGTHASPVGHIRRAHWHTYVTGSQKNKAGQRRELRWMPPIPVNIDDTDELIPTIRRISK